MKVIIAAAGTAGHINPGIAIANQIKKENPTAEITFIGTTRGLENDLVPRAGYELEAYGFSKEVSIENMKKIIKTIKGFGQAKQIVKKIKPDIVIGTGGYICGAVITAAHKLKIPTLLHESNAYPGKAVKYLSNKVDTILVCFEDAKKRLPKAKNVVLTGTPTKIKELQLNLSQKEEIKKKLKLSTTLPLILIFGGSQGAKKINDAIIQIIKQKINKNYQIMWAPGPTQFEIIKKELEQVNMDIDKIENAKIVPYIYNMEEVMNIADLIVARSGAMTITEIAITKKPAIFIPLPSISANRQEDNARVLEKLNAAKIILNDEVDGEILNKTIQELIKDQNMIEKMGKNAGKIEIKNVEEKIYKEIVKLVK